MDKRIIKNSLINIMLSLASLALFFLSVEFGGRWIFNRYPAGYDPGRFTRQDDVYGWLHRPNASGYWYRYADGTKNIATTNSKGFSDREFPETELPDTFRVAIIGDSVAQSWEVPKSKRFIEILHRKFDDLHGRKIELMNFAVRGYGTDQELLLLKNKVIHYSPNLVILSFCLNDMNDILDHSGKPFYELDNGLLTLRNVPVKRYPKSWSSFNIRDPMKYFKLHSWLFLAVYERSWLKSFDNYLKWRINRHFPDSNNSERRWINFNRSRERTNQGWLLFKELLRNMKTISDIHQADFAVIDNVTKQVLEMLNTPLELRDRNFDNSLPFRTLKRICGELGIEYIDVFSFVERGDFSPLDLFHREDNLHYNVRGNALLAKILEEYLIRKAGY